MTDTPRRRLAPFALGLMLLAALVFAAAIGLELVRNASVMTEDEIRDAIRTGIAAEAAEGFVVTGRLASTLERSTTRRWRVRLLDIETGRTTVDVRVPATMTYGFPLDGLGADDIRFREGGVVEVVLPALEVFSVEPELEAAEIDIAVSGQARLTPSQTERTVETTLRRVRPALRAQAESHLRTSSQPRVNTARAVQRMLATPLEAADVDLADVRFRFVLAPGDTLDVAAEGERRAVPAE